MQKLINPFNLESHNPYPGILIRNDKVISSSVSFNLKENFMYMWFISKFDSFVPTLAYQDMRALGSLWGLSIRDDLFKKNSDFTTKFVTDVLYCMEILTSKEKPFWLTDYINCNITEIPLFLLEWVQFVNSHKYIQNINGTMCSMFNWISVSIHFEFNDNKRPKGFSNPSELKLRISRLNETCKILSFLKVVNISGNEELFESSGHELSVSINSDNKDTLINCGRDVTEEEIFTALLLGVEYKIGDPSIVQSYNFKLTESRIIQILKINSELFNNPSLNLSNSDRLTNEYLTTDIASNANEVKDFRGFKSRSGRVKNKRNISKQKRKVTDNHVNRSDTVANEERKLNSKSEEVVDNEKE